MGAKTDLLQLWNANMLNSGQAAYGYLPAGQLSAASSWTTSLASFQLAQTVPSWVVASMNVYNVTAANSVGTVSAATSTTLTLSANAAHVSAGANDVLQFGFTPTELATGWTDGVDLNGMVEACQMHCAEAIYMLNYLITDVITSGNNSTILSNTKTALS